VDAKRTDSIKIVVHGQYRREFNARLLEFLRIELDVIATLIDKAKITRWAKSRQQSLDDSTEALRTIRKLEDRIITPADRKRIHNRADDLEKLISLL
jgi:hypothetical protein